MLQISATEFSCLLYLPTSYFCLQCFTRFDGFKSHFPKTKGSRQSVTRKRNPRPKPSQLRMALHMPNSTCGVSHCLMEHCHIINLHEFTFQMNQSLDSLVSSRPRPPVQFPQFSQNTAFYYFCTQISSCTSQHCYPTKFFTS